MGRRDYSSKKLHAYNPPRKSVRRDQLKSEILKRRLKIGGLIIVCISFLSGLLYLLLFSSVFMIRYVIVKDINGREETHLQLEQLIQATLAETVWRFFPRKNYFVLSPEFLLEKMNSTPIIPPIREVEVKKKWPHTIEVLFKKRIARLKVMTLTEEYTIDDYGVVVRKGRFKEDLEKYPIVRFLTNVSFKEGGVLLQSDVLSNIVYLYHALAPADYNVDYFEFKENLPNEIVVEIHEGYRVLFSRLYPLQIQINNLVLSLEKIGDDKRDKLQYIDLRVEGRAYACCNLGI